MAAHCGESAAAGSRRRGTVRRADTPLARSRGRRTTQTGAARRDRSRPVGRCDGGRAGAEPHDIGRRPPDRCALVGNWPAAALRPAARSPRSAPKARLSARRGRQLRGFIPRRRALPAGVALRVRRAVHVHWEQARRGHDGTMPVGPPPCGGPVVGIAGARRGSPMPLPRLRLAAAEAQAFASFAERSDGVAGLRGGPAPAELREPPDGTHAGVPGRGGCRRRDGLRHPSTGMRRAPPPAFPPRQPDSFPPTWAAPHPMLSFGAAPPRGAVRVIWSRGGKLGSVAVSGGRPMRTGTRPKPPSASCGARSGRCGRRRPRRRSPPCAPAPLRALRGGDRFAPRPNHGSCCGTRAAPR